MRCTRWSLRTGFYISYHLRVTRWWDTVTDRIPCLRWAEWSQPWDRISIRFPLIKRGRAVAGFNSWSLWREGDLPKSWGSLQHQSHALVHRCKALGLPWFKGLLRFSRCPDSTRTHSRTSAHKLTHHSRRITPPNPRHSSISFYFFIATWDHGQTNYR